MRSSLLVKRPMRAFYYKRYRTFNLVKGMFLNQISSTLMSYTISKNGDDKMSSKPVQIPKKSTLVYNISLLMLMMCKQQKGANVLQPPVKGLTLTALVWLPVNDSMPVQEHQRRCDLSRVKARSRLVELP